MARKKFARRLREEPVDVTIGEDNEWFRLQYMDPLKRPKNSEIPETLSLMKTGKDYENLVPFLSGLLLSHRSLKSPRWQWLIRRAGEADKLGVILECAKQSKRTGLQLSDIEIVQTLFFQLHLAANKAGFKDPVLSKVFGIAKQFVELMETPEHAVHDVQLDPKRKPFLIGVLLELSSALAVNHNEGVDASGDALAYAQRLCAVWEFGNYTTSFDRWPEADQLLKENIPVLNALRLALQIKGIDRQSQLYAALKSNRGQVEEQLKALKEGAPEKVQQKPTLGYSNIGLVF